MEDHVLAGVRVLEIGGGIPAAFATRWMAGYGADVVRTEGLADALTGDEEVYLLAGKRRIDVGATQLQQLAAQADIIVEDGRPGALAEAGMDPGALRAARPELVFVSVTPYGQDGPHADWDATNITSFASGGLMSLTGMYQREPLVTGGSQAQYVGGLNGFGAAVTAYLGAMVHGEGDWVDISLQECMAGMLELYGPRGAVEGVASVRAGNHVRASWGVYPCADGFAAVCALERQIPAFFSVVGDPALFEPRMRDPIERASYDDELQAIFFGWFAERTKAEILELGAKHKVPFGAVQTPRDLLANETLAERAYFDRVATPVGTATIPGRPFLGLPWKPGRLSTPGADTGAVLRDWLGVPQ
ncbi:MAG TPA: CaiB/BaiF CoA-transferase family protein [Tepidiformaceae bacterium]|nr:CaiB/BaiF CoA-transferase family protein [Tepidiformaceae bacterium]